MINSYANLLSLGFNVACKYSCLFSLPAPRDFLGKDNLTAFLAQKFLTDDKPVQNLLRSAEWLMFLIYSFFHCLLMIDRDKRSPSSFLMQWIFHKTFIVLGIYSSLQEAFEFVGTSSQKNSKFYDYRPEEMISNKPTAGTPWLLDKLCNLWFTWSVWTFGPKMQNFPF